MKRIIVFVLVLVFVLSSCGNDAPKSNEGIDEIIGEYTLSFNNSESFENYDEVKIVVDDNKTFIFSYIVDEIKKEYIYTPKFEIVSQLEYGIANYPLGCIKFTIPSLPGLSQYYQKDHIYFKSVYKGPVRDENNNETNANINYLIVFDKVK